MRNFSNLSRIVKLSSWAFVPQLALPVRTANYVATLLTRGFENSQQQGEVLALFLAGEIDAAAVEFVHTPSEVDVILGFVAWLRREYDGSSAAFNYINLNTGFSVTFLAVGRRTQGSI